ncbi:MAG: hypothetical protein A2Y40_00475 [Candidatus Margulisbacteria bacterium GWF2_35_9]|nr:MAG: hypothetical protein A2Y40_00475 [Candidatus Margulisbacteria bacterium GWF2_35_9]
MERNLVFVDDNETIVGIMEMELAGVYNITTFIDPIKALEYIKNNRDKVDILLTDFMMPQMNGLQLVEETKKINSSIRTIILTGYCKEIEDERKSSCDLLLDKNILVDNNNLIEILDQN